MGMNLRLISSRLGLLVNELLSVSSNKFKNICYNKWYENINIDYKAHASVIRDMIEMKETSSHTFFTKEFCDNLIQYLCVS